MRRTVILWGLLALTAGVYAAGGLSGGAGGSTVTAPATGAGVDTCTGGGCAVGASGISTDAGIIINPVATPWTMDVAAGLFRLSQGGSIIQSCNNSTGVCNYPFGLSSTIGSGSVAIQTLSGAKTCLGTGGLGCLTHNGTGFALSTNLADTNHSGTVTLAAGSGTATVLAGALCVCQDTAAAAGVITRCNVAATTLTITEAAGTNVIAYHCF